MKKQLQYFAIVFMFLVKSINAQCVQQCGVYSLSPITYTVYPNLGIPVFLSDDDTTGFLPIGFNFNFYCNTYSQVKICSNGFITFDNNSFTLPSTPYAQSLPSPTLPNAVIAYNWNDLDPSAGGTVFVNTIGTSPNQQFIVTYSAVPLWSITPQVLNTGQIVLNEIDGSIEIHVTTAGHNGWLTATEGIENATASSGSAVIGRNLSLWTATNSSHKWEKVIAPTAPTNIGNGTLICTGTQQTYTCDIMNGATAYNWNFPPSWQGSSNTNSLMVTTGLTGMVSVNATYSCGTSPNSNLFVTIYPAPYVSVTNYTPSIICYGAAASVSVAGALSYTMQPGNISGISPLTVVPPATTNYSIYGTDVNGCVNISPASLLLTIYPSPSITVSSGSICLGESFDLSPKGALTYTYSHGGLYPQVIPTTTGSINYFVVGTNSSGCIGTASAVLVVNNNPLIFASASKSVVCANQSITLTAQGANSYTWSNNSTGATVTAIPPVSTEYTVTGKSTDGCYTAQTISITVSPCIGLKENNFENNTLIYPNPSFGEFTIMVLESSTLIIYNIEGKEVYNQYFKNAGDALLNLNYLNSGQYFVKIISDKEINTGIWIKE